jgi:hypothetical protein
MAVLVNMLLKSAGPHKYWVWRNGDPIDSPTDTDNTLRILAPSAPLREILNYPRCSGENRHISCEASGLSSCCLFGLSNRPDEIARSTVLLPAIQLVSGMLFIESKRSNYMRNTRAHRMRVQQQDFHWGWCWDQLVDISLHSFHNVHGGESKQLLNKLYRILSVDGCLRWRNGVNESCGWYCAHWRQSFPPNISLHSHHVTDVPRAQIEIPFSSLLIDVNLPLRIFCEPGHIRDPPAQTLVLTAQYKEECTKPKRGSGRSLLSSSTEFVILWPGTLTKS